jgi:hypothetical protein
MFNKFLPHIRRRTNVNNPYLTSVTGNKLDAKGSIHLDVKRDDRIFPTSFIIWNNFPYEAIIGANFLRSNKVLLDEANERLVYPANTPSPTLGDCKRGYEENVAVNKISGGIMSQSFEPHVLLQRGRGIIRNSLSYSER